MHRGTIGLRPRSFVVLRQRSPASTGVCSPTKEPVTTAAHPRPVTSPAPAFFSRHVVLLPVANQPARFQCASRSFTKVFVGRRLAPLPAPGKYRCPSSARFCRSSATLTVMASPNHLHCSQACGAKYGVRSRVAALPNPSVKASTNGRPGYSHLLFLLPPGLPLVPPYLER